MECDLRIVGAGLHGKIAAGALRLELIAGEPRQLDQRGWPPCGEAVAIMPILLEQARAETEGEGEARGLEAQRFAAIGRGLRRIEIKRRRGVRPAVIRADAAVQRCNSDTTSSRFLALRSKAAK